MKQEDPAFIAECAAYAEMEREAEKILLVQIMSQHKQTADGVIVYLLTRLLNNG